jgi:hypothetical protein
MKVIYKGKVDKEKNNWLCGNCKCRPPGNMTIIKDNNHYCIYCKTKLEFNKE